MDSFRFFLVVVFLVVSVVDANRAEARKKRSGEVYRKIFDEYSVKNVVRAKTAKAKRLRASLKEGDVFIEYSFSKKKISGDKHSLLNLKAVVMQKISDNFVKEPEAHLIPSGKVGAAICAIEGHEGFFRTRFKFSNRKKPSYLVSMSDRHNQRILQKNIEKYKVKGSKIDPNEASEILITQSFLKSVDALCTD